MPTTTGPRGVKFKKRSSYVPYTTVAEKFREISSSKLVLHFLNWDSCHRQMRLWPGFP